MENLNDRAKSYSRIKHIIQIFELSYVPIILFLILYFKINIFIEAFVLKITNTPYLGLFFYFIFFGLLLYIIELPLNFFSQFILEHRFSLSNQTFFCWIKKEAKGLIVTFLIGLIFAEIAYFFIRNFQAHWWFLAAFIWIIFLVFLGKFTPVLILPLFYRVRPTKDTELNSRLLNLAKKSKTDVNGIFEIDFSKDTKKANASLVGIGKTRRIILCDTLLKNFSMNEIEAVLAHELGHHKGAHIKKLLILSSLLILINLYIADLIFYKTHNYFKIKNLQDLSSLPLLLFTIVFLGLFIRPILNGYSRNLETSADIFALKLTGDANSFINVMKRLAEQNLSDISPNRFFEIMLYDHPPISKRIALAEKYK